MADLVACIGLVINPDKIRSLAITIKQPPAPDYNQFTINLFGWDTEKMGAVR